jgi:hypothetical protein
MNKNVRSSTSDQGRRLRKILLADPAFAILDRHIGGTWLEGGCGLLAATLEKMGMGQLWVLEGCQRGSTVHQVHHFLVRAPDGMFLDGDGASSEQTLLHRWKDLESIPDASVRPATTKDKTHVAWVVVKLADVDDLAKLLAPK